MIPLSNSGNNRKFYESLVPSNITDPQERERMIQLLIEKYEGKGPNQKEGDSELQYFTE